MAKKVHNGVSMVYIYKTELVLPVIYFTDLGHLQIPLAKLPDIKR